MTLAAVRSDQHDLPASGREPDGSVVVRVLSYNIRSLRDEPGQRPGTARQTVARVIRATAPDVVCVQEAPRFFRWRKALARLARDAELFHVTGGATTTGPAIFSTLRAQVEHTEEVLLPRTPGQHRRGFAAAVLRFGEVRLGVVSCHLSPAAGERYNQAGALLNRLSGLDAPYAVLAGDLNERPDGRAFQRLTGPLCDAWVAKPWGSEYTSTPADPRQRPDAVLTTEGVEVLGCGVPNGLAGVRAADLHAAADHLPVLAALRLPQPPTATS
ncbi:endonuclease/exonuclease/phosphatase family protein [Streptomyces zagrosensis]|uniref:Endonuclease/exonuclease/phosphatase family metal-dependent hydrolase n=1 Tax=Streptomyces zagrosensis TaxID=1042984 RepID=A0A7W9Q4G1_9ACTN|nr:endonuclease/exonuclease/phosphatase family protein [Streptomyces zagrosensis]MBB5933443.1 endonuclease/exonuclease/phosphatase family metal-dependent hydrolase [Streptomyces zagrosensis]